jgi:hypothetical protein
MTTTMPQRAEPISWSRPPAPALAGLVVWVVAMVQLPAPLAARILLLAPLVVVPRLIQLLPPRRWVTGLGGWPSLLAALPLVAAFSLPTGPVAAALALPWLIVALVGAAAAVMDGLSQLPSILEPRHLPALGTDVALGFWGVAAAFAMIDRLGVDTGFSPVIVLLTATHFHFAGFGLLGLASLFTVARPWLRASVLGLIVGIPLTAAGFMLVSDPINAIGALVVGSAGIGVAIALLTGRARGAAGWASKVAGIALLVGMPMGMAWSLAILTGQTFLDLDTMIRTHGVLNSIAVLIAVASYPAYDESMRHRRSGSPDS